MNRLAPGGRLQLEPLPYDALAGFPDDDHPAALRCFLRSACALADGLESPRPARPPSAGLIAAADAALAVQTSAPREAGRFFEDRFRPFRVDASGSGFLTGYYEPCVEAGYEPAKEFSWPLLARPDGLVSFAPEDAPGASPPGVTGARRLPGGGLVPYDDREAIERGCGQPIAWVRDSVEAFLIQVQGSAQLRFPDGRRARLAYDGRNGLPYTSIGRILVESGEIAEAEMSLARLKAWLRAAGAEEGGRGLELMRRNRSYVFFKLVQNFDPSLGPLAGSGAALTPLRSIAVDRALWSYGTPFWIDAKLPWRSEQPEPFRRLMIAQDTGSAIVGPARADLFFGSGEAAGERAGAIRHRASFVVLLPCGGAR